MNSSLVESKGTNQMKRTILRLCSTLVAFLPAAASAHVGIGDTHGFAHGFFHPLGGIDHILTMVAVGVFANNLGGRAIWLVPLAFVSVMAAAGVMGMAGIGLPFMEIGIGLSVVVLGLVVAFQLSLPTVAAMALVGFFAIFHGHAHGAEMPESFSGIAYGVGFVCATALLHGVGIGLGQAVGRVGQSHSRRIIQVGGGAMAVAGVAILAGVL
jgi:urease accessory protein